MNLKKKIINYDFSNPNHKLWFSENSKKTINCCFFVGNLTINITKKKWFYLKSASNLKNVNRIPALN